MCSWCWGFSPVVEQVARTYADRAPLTVVSGGLRPGVTTPMTTEDRSYVREHWEHVQERTGQPFDWNFFERDTFVYDTEPACRAVVVARELAPGSELGYLAALHGAFYRDGLDITDAEVLTSTAEQAGLDREAFAARLETAESRTMTVEDFRLASELGVRGFPSLIGRDGERLSLLTAGYQPLEAIEQAMGHWLESTD